MIIDGRALAQDIFEDLKKKVSEMKEAPTLSVILIGDNPASQSYVRLKTRKAEYVGVRLNLLHFDTDVSQDDVLSAIDAEVEKGRSIIVQMPLPDHFDASAILNQVPARLDIDILSEEGKRLFKEGTLPMLHPVVGSMSMILKKYGIDIKGKNVVVVGRGALVGAPAAAWFTNEGARVSVAGKSTENLKELTGDADIVVCGAGVPGLITPDMVKDGVAILDAGTSEDAGVLKGDADPACAEKAALFTPVPGGIGPMTVAVLLKNVVDSHSSLTD